MSMQPVGCTPWCSTDASADAVPGECVPYMGVFKDGDMGVSHLCRLRSVGYSLSFSLLMLPSPVEG